MSDNVIRKYEPEEAATKRLEFIQRSIVPPVKAVFADFPDIKSAVLMVSQFWCDEAYDAVHGNLVYSLSAEPDLDRHRREIERLAVAEARFEADDYESLDNEEYAYSNFIEGPEAVAALGEAAKEITNWDGKKAYQYWQDWDSNDGAIPLFAAFCMEGGHQEGGELEFSLPCAILRRAAGNDVTVEVLGTMARPWMDGVQPEWETLAESSGGQSKSLGTLKKKSFWSRLFGR